MENLALFDPLKANGKIKRWLHYNLLLLNSINQENQLAGDLYLVHDLLF